MHTSSDEYKLTDLVGKGSFGFVWKGLHKPTNKIFAIKILSLDVNEAELVDVQHEIALLGQLQQAEVQNVTKFYGSFLKESQLWIIMDYCSGGSVRTLMKPGRIEERYITAIIRETLLGLSFIHKFGIIHRDIKAANILVSNDGKVQLCDFGVSALLQGPQNKRTTFVGTPWWMAPEGQTYNFKADIWSLGITVLEIANGHPPYHDQEPMRALLMIPKQPPSRLEGGNWSQPLRDFVSYCLNELPEDRMSAEELQKTKLIKASKNIATSILRDLVNRMEIWSRKGGIRNSLIGGPDGFDMMSDMLGKDKEDEYIWDFDVTSSETGYTKPRSNTLTAPSSRAIQSFDEIEDAETIKPRQAAPGRSNVPPLPTGTDHPLLQLFAGRGAPAGQAQGVLQPGFQPTVVSTNGSSNSVFSPTLPRPPSPDQFATIEIPSFDDMGSSSIVIPELPDVPTIPMQIEIPSLDESYSNRPLPLLPPTTLPSAISSPNPINVQSSSTVPAPPFSPLPRSFQMMESMNSERNDRQNARGQRPDNAGMLSLNKTSDDVVGGITKNGPPPIWTKPPLSGIKTSETSRSIASPVPSSPARVKPSLDLQNTFKQSDIPHSSGTPVPPSPARSKQSVNRDPSPRRLPTTASAPSSPPRGPAFTHAMPSSVISNTNVVNSSAGMKSFHLPSKSVPTVSTHRDLNQDVPPIPNIGDSTEMRSAESTPNSRQRVAQEIRPITPNMINLNTINGVFSGGAQPKTTGGLPMSPNVNPNVNSSFPGPYGHASSTSLHQTKTHNVVPVHPPQSSQSQQARSFGSKRSDLSLKLPPSQFSSFDITSVQRSRSPRYNTPVSGVNTTTTSVGRPPLPTPSIFTPGLRTPRPTDRVMLPHGVEYDKWGMPTKFPSLNPRVLAPGTSSSDVSAELDRMLGLLGAGLDAMINGLETYKKPVPKKSQLPPPSSSSSSSQPSRRL